ncbi:MAG: PAS domain-containing protein [Myxococcales bacterium]|nr:PAS domain-containing protein [Myxococcales bacterium]
MAARFGLRERLIAASAVLIAIATVACYALLAPFIEAAAVERLHTESLARVRLVALRAVDAGTPLSLDSDAADRLADELGAAADARVTLFDATGRVVGDSSLDPAVLRDLGDPVISPEAVSALQGKPAFVDRFSTTAQEPLVFAAIPLERDGELIGAARVGLSEQPVHAASRVLLRSLATGALIAMVVAVALSGLASRLASQGVRELAGLARRMAGGELEVRAEPVEGDHLRDLGRSLEQLAEGLRNSLRELVSERDVSSGILTTMREGVLLVDRDGKIALINAALREMLLLGDADVGKLPLEVIRDAALHELLDTVRRTSKAAQGEIEVRGPKPRRLLVRAELLAVQPGGLLVVFYDVTDLRRLESLRRDFVANASHELRTPVTSIRSAAETVIGMPAGEAASQRFLAIIERNAERLQQLIDDLLDLSRLESRELSLARDPVDVAEVVRHVVELLSERAARSESKLVTVVDADVLEARADVGALEQVLQNLLDNALKYCPGATVTIGARSEGGKTILSVSDTGPGIEAKHLGRLFERFYRVDAGRSRSLGGTGLGLSIVKHLVEAMGGTVSVTSEVGRGTTFLVELPVAEAPLIERAPPSLGARNG